MSKQLKAIFKKPRNHLPLIQTIALNFTVTDNNIQRSAAPPPVCSQPLTLRAIDNEFYGFQDNWINAAHRMLNDGRLSTQDAGSLRWLSVFGSLIGNNDQHFGNVSLIMTDGSRLYNLAPAYDVLPMVYRPLDGALPSRPFTAPSVVSGAPNEWSSALESASQFRDRTRFDLRISEEFRMICSENCNIVTRLYAGPRLFA